MNSENMNSEDKHIENINNENKINNVSDWTIEDCETYVNTLYHNHFSRFKERKANALFRSHIKHVRRTAINNDGIYVNEKIFLSPYNIKKCVSVGNLYFFEQRNSILIKCVKADGEKSHDMRNFLAVNNIDFVSDAPDEVYRLRADAKLHKQSNKPLLIIAVIILLLSLSGLNINKKTPFYTADILKDAGLSSAVSSRYMDTVIEGLPSSEQTGMDTSQYNKLLSDIQSSIQNSPAIDSIARKYTDALTRGLRDGKTFDEINIDIDEELTSLAAIANNSITDNRDFSDDLKDMIILSLVLDKESTQKAINNYASGIYAELSYHATGLAGVYQIISSKPFYIIMLLLYAASIIIIFFSASLSLSRICLPLCFIIYAGLEYVICNVLMSKAVMLLSNRFLGRTASLNPTYANMDLISYVSVGIACAIILQLIYIKLKRRA